MSLTTVHSVIEYKDAFPFQITDITIPTKRPSATVIKKFISGMERNAQFNESNRAGCLGNGIGHKWLCWTAGKWTTKQTELMDKVFAAAGL